MSMPRNSVILNAVYQHYKGDYYKVVGVARHHEDPYNYIVIYNKCDENGIYKSIRTTFKSADGFDIEEFVHQPFYRSFDEFLSNVQGGYPNNPAIPRFKFVKQLNN